MTRTLAAAKALTAMLGAGIRFQIVKSHRAWTAVGVTELAVPGALVEIQIIARLR